MSRTIKQSIYDLLNIYQPYPKLITEHKDAIDQALKEIETLIKESKPKKVCHFATENGVPFDTDEDIAYNKALNDYEANLLKILGGKE